MTPERWQRIEALYHAALEREAGDRSAFLTEACGDDEGLRREVEGLLEQSGSLLDRPAWEALPAREEDASQPRLSSGARLGPYRIEAPIGAGGMGEVFRATDTRLHRTVAVKILPRDRMADRERKLRFVQEARAASALNHPNIVTLHDIASDRGVDYLVMEYVAGKPLDRLIAGKALPPAQTIDYGVQIASALAAAHAAGIVHRDIKPANLIVTAPDRSSGGGVVKVLDFGLAKRELPAPGADGATHTMEPSLTQTGVAIGTLAYMSPEQARGEEVDARTDLFSFGAVLHEMATGRRPFAKPLDWTLPAADSLPAELRPIVRKLLESDREMRYQHAAEVRTDLLRLQRAETKPAARRWKIVAPAAVVLVVLSLAGYFRLRGTPKLTDKDTIVLADFSNQTRDAVFDQTLRQGLAIQLEQSPFLSLISDERIQRTLGMMSQPADARLTPGLGRQICERTGSAAVLDGSIAPLGSEYVLWLRATDCHGNVLDEEQAQASKKEDVLNALSRMAARFRTRVGESLAMVQRHSTPLADATTPSLDALKAFSSGYTLLLRKGDGDAALPFFRRAVELDPNFAMAHAFIGRVYGDMGENALSTEALREAWRLRNRTTDAERFFITANYHLQVTGDLRKARETFELWEQTYPREVIPPGLLAGEVYPFFGEYEKAIAAAKRLMALDPIVPFSYVCMATAQQFLGRLEDAGATYRMANERGREIPEMLVQRYDLAFVRGDQAGVERIAAECLGKAGVEDWITYHHGMILAYSGHLRQAKDAAQRAAAMDQQGAAHDRAALFETAVALWDAFFGNTAAARQDAAEVLRLSRERDAEYGAALALALGGDSPAAGELAGDLAKRFPEDSSVHLDYLPALRAVLAMNGGRPAQAIEALLPAIPYDFGVPMSWFNGSFGALYTVYLRGQAYLAMHRGPEAAAEFQKILDHRGIVAADPIGALAHLKLGRALMLADDRVKAKAAYEEFLDLWKEADPDIPILKQAKAEYEALR